MDQDLHRAFEVVVGIEGGYVNDPKDPGGETKWGISKRAYPALDIKNLTRQEAEGIYLRDYWLKCKCDQLKWPLNLFLFDSAVNQGHDAAIKMLQKALGVAQDGMIGPITLGKAKLAGPEQIAMFMSYRALRYTGTRNFDRYGTGWFKRMFLVAFEAK